MGLRSEAGNRDDIARPPLRTGQLTAQQSEFSSGEHNSWRTDYLPSGNESAPAEDSPSTDKGMRVQYTTTAVLLAALAATACGTAATGSGTPPQPESASTADLEAIYQARLDSARMRFVEADVHFMTGMIAHHAQALVMSALAPTNGASPTIQTLAARIINAQKDEIASMQQWLRDRGQETPEVHGTGTMTMVHGPSHAMHMPGMLTPEQMQELKEARGREFDRLFLTYMIQHHAGAVTMVHELFATDGAAQEDVMFKIASDIQVDQITEIERMKLMLEQMEWAGNH